MDSRDDLAEHSATPDSMSIHKYIRRDSQELQITPSLSATEGGQRDRHSLGTMVNQTNVADFDKDEKFDEPGFVEASPTTHKMTPAEIADAQRAALAGAQMSFGEAFSKYKKGLFWSMTVSCVSRGTTNLSSVHK